jgi:septal ring factor EnvC (AmiA/AmiB activator)
MAQFHTVVIRALRGELDNVKAATAALRANKEAAVAERDGMQIKLDAIKASIQIHNASIQEAQTLVDALQAEIASMQTRSVTP